MMQKSLQKTQYKPNNKGTKTLFNNPTLEKLSRTHIAVPISLLLLYAVALIFWSILRTEVSSTIIFGLYITGFISFTLVEYLLHRFVYHMRTNTNIKKNIQYHMHGIHHEYPKDKDRLAMPPLLSMSITSLLLYLLHLLIGSYSFSFLSGFTTGYALYLFMHYILHRHKAPKNGFKKLWVYHSIHHYKDESVYFGVSTPVWDYVFGTRYKNDKI